MKTLIQVMMKMKMKTTKKRSQNQKITKKN
jgi:hypothetical protein